MVRNDGHIEIKEGKQTTPSPIINSQSLPLSSQQQIINLDINSTATENPLHPSSLTKKASELSVSSAAASNQEQLYDSTPNRQLEPHPHENFYKEKINHVENNRTLDSGAFSELGQSSKEESISGEMDLQEPYPKIIHELEKVIEVR